MCLVRQGVATVFSYRNASKEVLTSARDLVETFVARRQQKLQSKSAKALSRPDLIQDPTCVGAATVAVALTSLVNRSYYQNTKWTWEHQNTKCHNIFDARNYQVSIILANLW